jgi:hypothetical protein
MAAAFTSDLRAMLIPAFLIFGANCVTKLKDTILELQQNYVKATLAASLNLSNFLNVNEISHKLMHS